MLAIIILITIIPVQVTSYPALFCPPAPPYQVLKIPRINPCHSRQLKEGSLTTRAPNSAAYVTNATLVSISACWANSSTGFFGQHTCHRDCLPRELGEVDARGIAHGFCPDAATGLHAGFDTTHGGLPWCTYAWMRSLTTMVIRCRRLLGHMIYTNGGEPHSTLAPRLPCKYETGQCRYHANSWLFWEVDERSADKWRETTQNKALCDGKRVWIPGKNIGFGLKKDGCDWEGFADTYEGVQLKWEGTPKTRARRSTGESKKLMSVMEFLYGELETESGTFCETMIGAVPASTLMPHAMPSLYARELLNDSALVASSSGEYLFIHKCSPVMAEPRNGSSCHSLPRIKYMDQGQWQMGFLSASHQVVDKATKRPCENHVMAYALNGRPYIEVGTHTSEGHSTMVTSPQKSPLAGLHPGYTNIFFQPMTWDTEIEDIVGMQSQLISHARLTGASVGGSGGGLGLVNLPGLKPGVLESVVAFFQTVGATGGVLYIVAVSLRAIKGIGYLRPTHPGVIPIPMMPQLPNPSGGPWAEGK